MNKRGAEFTITTLIVIVLAIIVLVVLALGFGAGWGNLWSKITGYFSPVNVDSVKQACQYAATTRASYDYCCRIREVKFTSDGTAQKLTCQASSLRGETVLSCSKSTCASVVCEGSYQETVKRDSDTEAKKYNVVLKAGVVVDKDVADGKCLASDVDSTRIFDTNLGILENTKQVCCKAYVLSTT